MAVRANHLLHSSPTTAQDDYRYFHARLGPCVAEKASIRGQGRLRNTLSTWMYSVSTLKRGHQQKLDISRDSTAPYKRGLTAVVGRSVSNCLKAAPNRLPTHIWLNISQLGLIPLPLPWLERNVDPCCQPLAGSRWREYRRCIRGCCNRGIFVLTTAAMLKQCFPSNGTWLVMLGVT
jgi:hypothetical protein